MRARFLAVILGLTLVTALLVYVSLQGQSTTAVSLLVSGGTVVTMDGADRVIPDGTVAIGADKIVAVGPAEEMAGRYSAPQRIDARGQIVLPGLINTHTHAPMVLFRGLADDLALMDWLNRYIFP